jgi:hypothetical protein
MTASSLMHLTRIDGAKVVIVKEHMVCWSKSDDHHDAHCIMLSNGRFQDVKESAAEIIVLFTKA